MTGLAPIARPDGGIYRPRKLSANAVNDYHGDELEGVVVFGTHDADVAFPLAEQYAQWIIDAGYTVAVPVLVWWRDGFDNGARCWITDPVRGRAGVWFSRIEELPRPD